MQATPPPPAATPRIHYEDIEVGRAVTFGAKLVTKEEVIEFALAFDPQPFHTSEEEAKATHIGELIASGWHSCAMLMRMICDNLLNEAASEGSPGMEEVRWLKPVRPGDVVRGRFTCTAKRVLKSRPHVGLCQTTFEMLNQHGDVVMTWDSAQLYRLRSPGAQP
jgi:acyl dehydratase